MTKAVVVTLSLLFSVQFSDAGAMPCPVEGCRAEATDDVDLMQKRIEVDSAIETTLTEGVPVIDLKGPPPVDVMCDFTADNYVTKVYIDGVDKTSEVSGNLNSWPTKKSMTFKSNAQKLAFQVNDAEQGCHNGGFAISCRSKATNWAMSSNSKSGWKVFSVKAGGSPTSLAASQHPPSVSGKKWYETGYTEGRKFRNPRFGYTTYADRVIKTDGKDTKDFCGGDFDDNENHWFFTFRAPPPAHKLQLQEMSADLAQ